MLILDAHYRLVLDIGYSIFDAGLVLVVVLDAGSSMFDVFEKTL